MDSVLWTDIFILLIAIVAAPIIGGILTGVDRKITARMQSGSGHRLCPPGTGKIDQN
jgi:ech hydrogenase subunit B